MKLASIRYYGGKSVMGRTGASCWIANQLHPPSQKRTYVEPFAGMLGVLLQRSRAKFEIANDLNGEIVNWWTMVRDRGDELREKLYHTPYSEKEFHMSYTDTDDPLEQARRTTIKLVANLIPSTFIRSFRVRFDGDRPTCTDNFRVSAERIPALQDRIHRVTLLCRPAEKLMARLANESTTMIYCDPPYRDANTSPYGDLPFNRGEFTELLRSQTGSVAISGYGDEWDHLGWVRSEYRTHVSIRGMTTCDPPARTEVLWTNYQPEPNNSQLGMFE